MVAVVLNGVTPSRYVEAPPERASSGLFTVMDAKLREEDGEER